MSHTSDFDACYSSFDRATGNCSTGSSTLILLEIWCVEYYCYSQCLRNHLLNKSGLVK